MGLDELAPSLIFCDSLTAKWPGCTMPVARAYQRALAHLQVQWGGALANAAGAVVVGAVAWAEPASPITLVNKRDATQVRAHTNHDEPLRSLGTDCVNFWITHRSQENIVLLGLGNHVWCPAAHEDRLSAPLNNKVLTHLYWAKVNLNNACCKDILGWPQGMDCLAHNGSNDGDRNETKTC